MGRTQVYEQFRTDNIHHLNLVKGKGNQFNLGKCDPKVDAENLIEENNLVESSVFKDGGETCSLEGMKFIGGMKNRQ